MKLLLQYAVICCELEGITETSVQQTMSESTTCDETTSTIHFPVLFGPIYQIFFLKNVDLFSTPVNFLTVREPPYGERTENIS